MSLEPEHLQTSSPSVLWGLAPMLPPVSNSLRNILPRMLQWSFTPSIRQLYPFSNFLFPQSPFSFLSGLTLESRINPWTFFICNLFNKKKHKPCLCWDWIYNLTLKALNLTHFPQSPLALFFGHNYFIYFSLQTSIQMFSFICSL